MEAKSLLNEPDAAGNGIPDPLNVGTIYTDNIYPLIGPTLTIHNAIFSPPPPSAPADSVFNIANPGSFDWAGCRLSTDALYRWLLNNLGVMSWGSGAATRDTFLYRSAAGRLNLGSTDANSSGSLSLNNLSGATVDTTGDMTVGGDIICTNQYDARFTPTNRVVFYTGVTGDPGDWNYMVTSNGCVRLGGRTTNLVYASLRGNSIGDLTVSTSDDTDPLCDGSIVLRNVKTKVGSGSNLVLLPDGPSIDCSNKSLINVVLPSSSLSFPITYAAPGSGSSFYEVSVSGDGFPRLSAQAGGFLAIGRGDIAPDVFLSRGGGSDVAGGGVAGELLITATSADRTGGRIAVSAIRGSGGGLQILGGPVDFTAGNIFNIAQMSAATISLSNTLSTSSMIASRVTLETQPRFGVDVDGQLSWGSGGAVSRDTWMYRTFDNTLRISSTSRGPSSTGILEVGTLRSTIVANVDLLNVNGSSSNSASGTSQVLIVGQSNTLTSCTRALVSGASNSIENASSSAIVGSSSCVIDASSATSANNFIGGCTSVNIGTGAGTGGTNNVILATNSRMSLSNGTSFVLAKGAGFSIGRSGVVIFGDDGVGFAGSTTIGADQIFQCAFRSGYYFTSDTARTVGVQVAPGANSWTSISDVRLKNVWGEIPVASAYDALDSVRVVNYSWKNCPDKKKQLGMIAQEVNSAFSSFMPKRENPCHQYSIDHPDEEPIQTVSGDDIAYISMAMIKHQKALIEELTGEVTELKKRVANQAVAIKKLLAV